MHWLLHFIGADNLSGTAYGFWSGFGSDIGELAIIGGLISVVRRHNCEVKGCWRLGRHKTAAAHQVCRKHHPDDHLTPQDVTDAHEAAQAPPPITVQVTPPPAPPKTTRTPRTTKTAAGSGT